MTFSWSSTILRLSVSHKYATQSCVCRFPWCFPIKLLSFDNSHRGRKIVVLADVERRPQICQTVSSTSKSFRKAFSTTDTTCRANAILHCRGRYVNWQSLCKGALLFHMTRPTNRSTTRCSRSDECGNCINKAERSTSQFYRSWLFKNFSFAICQYESGWFRVWKACFQWKFEIVESGFIAVTSGHLKW